MRRGAGVTLSMSAVLLMVLIGGIGIGWQPSATRSRAVTGSWMLPDTSA